MSSTSSRFFVTLTQELMTGMGNCYGADNWDPARFGGHQSSFKRSIVTKFNQIFSRRIAIVPVSKSRQGVEKVSKIEDSLDGLAWFYDLLADEYSRSILVKVLAYRLIGPESIKLPLNTEAYWAQRADMTSLVKSSDSIKVNYPDLLLNHLSLEKIGYPIELFFPPTSVVGTFVLKQYEYLKAPAEIRVQDGDYVIDAGGCWGETALYFAHAAGEGGKVFSFEFTPENLEILHRNIGLNPRLEKRIELEQRALWNISGETLNYSSMGPGTSLYQSGSNGDQEALSVTTVSIDDFVKERKLPKLDFIKMDIEGAELDSLKGAEETLRAFKPRLAISIYHRDTDFIEIPEYLSNLGLGYNFYLDHFTIYGEETVLFAAPKTV